MVGCWLLAYVVRFYVFGPAARPHPGVVAPLGPYLAMIVPILVVWGVSFRAFDLYRPRRIGSRLSEIADVAKASTLAGLVLVAIMTFLFREYEYSRVVIIYFWLFSIAAVSFARYVFREVLRFARRRGYNQRYAVVVGGGELAQHVIERLRARPDTGIQVVGLVGDAKESAGGVPWLGAYADLAALLAARPVDHVILALAHEDASRLPGLLDAIGDEPVTIHVVPDLFRFTSLRGGIEEFEGVPFVHLRESPLHGWNAVAKRAFDLVFAASVLVALAPVLAVLAAAVRLTSPGPILYRQDRMGLDGQSFRMLKFRTMKVDAEAGFGPGLGPGGGRAADVHRRLSPPLQPRRAAAVRERPPRRDERGGAAPGAARLRRALPPDRARLHAPPQGEVRGHRLGPDQRAARQYLAGAAHRVRHPVHRALVLLARPQDHRADAWCGCSPTGTPTDVERLRAGPARPEATAASTRGPSPSGP